VTTRRFLEICGPHCAKRSVGRLEPLFQNIEQG
jgi:hypothetical protein